MEAEPHQNEPLYIRTSRVMAFDLSARVVFADMDKEQPPVRTPFEPGHRYYFTTLEHFRILNEMTDEEARTSTSIFNLFNLHRELFYKEFSTKNPTTYGNWLKVFPEISVKARTETGQAQRELQVILSCFNRLSRYTAEKRLVDGFREFIDGQLTVEEQDLVMGTVLRSDLFYECSDPDYWYNHSPAFKPNRMPTAFIEWVTAMRQKYFHTDN